MLDPYRTGCCGKHLSEAKAKKVANSNRQCPLCSAPSPAKSSAGRKVFTANPDPEFQDKILELQVRCFYNEDGCGWEGSLRDFQSHMFSCDMQAWKCQYCDFRSTQLIGTTEHAQKCENRPIQCSCNDASLIPFHEYEAHLITCPAQLVPCELAGIGCLEKFPRSKSAHHMKDYMPQHQLLISQQNLKILTAMSTRLEVHEDKEGVPKLKEDLVAREAEVERLHGVVSAKEEEVRTFKEKLETMVEEVRKLEEQAKQSQSENAKLLISMEQNHKESIRRQQTLFKMFEEQAKQRESEKKEEIASMEKKHKDLMETKEAEIERFQQEARQLERRHVSNKEEADIEQLVRPENNPSANLAIDTVLELTENLRSNHQKGLSGAEVAATVKKLDDFLSTALNTDFMDSSSSDSDSSPTAGKLERVILEDLKKPWGVAVFGTKVYVVDTNGTFGLHITTPQDKNSSTETMIASATISEVSLPVGKCWYPRGVIVDNDGNIILVDTGTHRILKFSPVGKLLHTVGTESTPGNASGEFNGPVGIGISPEGKVFVCDCFNHRVQILGPDLRFLEEFGEMGDGPKKFLRPWDVAFDKQGNVYIADCGNRCVKVFTAGLEPVKVIGQGNGKAYKMGDLRAPSSLCIDKNDFLYVADKSLGSVFVYDNQGIMKCRFGRLTEPRGVAVDKEGRVYVTDMGGWSYFKPFKAPGRVQMYS